MMNVTRSSDFPATREEVFARLQRLDTLQRVVWPYATFEPVGEDAGLLCASPAHVGASAARGELVGLTRRAR